MKKLKVVSDPKKKRAPGFFQCPVVITTLECGETLKRGCGRPGLVSFEAGWRCFYCGHYLYDPRVSLDKLWFHFKMGREYWRVHTSRGRDFVNGVPVRGTGDPLPRRYLRDLSEPMPPRWFGRFMQEGGLQ